MTRRPPALTETAPLLLADGSPYVATPARRGWPLMVPLRTGGRHALPDPPAPAGPDDRPAKSSSAPVVDSKSAASGSDEDAGKPDSEAVKPKPRGWAWRLANAAFATVVLPLVLLLAAWAMWAMLHNVGTWLEAHYPDQFPRPAQTPFWQGPAAAGVLIIDAGMIAWTLLDLWTRFLDRENAWLKVGARTLALTSVLLNAITGTDLWTVLVHAGPAALYVGSVEILAWLMTSRRGHRRRNRRRNVDSRWVPFSQWLVEFGSARRMTFEMLAERIDYAEALARRGRRRAARAAFEQAFGEGWRGQVPLPVADAYRRGAIGEVDPVRLVVDARRMHAELNREMARFEAVTHVSEATQPTGSGADPRGKSAGRPADPRADSPRDPLPDPGSDSPPAQVIQLRHGSDPHPLSSGDSRDPVGQRGESPPLELTEELMSQVFRNSRPGPDTVAAIRATLLGEYTGRAAAEAYGVPDSTVNRWVGRFRAAAREATHTDAHRSATS